MPSENQVVVRPMWGPDLQKGFFEALGALRKAELTPEKAREIHRLRLHRGIKTYVAVIGERIVGTATLLIEQKFYGVAGHIEDVAVDPNFQGYDIGGKLVRHAVEQAKQLGCYKVILDCTEQVAPFYRKLGFHEQNIGMRLDL